MVYRARGNRAAALHADVIEVFASAQGEGIYLGERQTFVRFAGCNLACLFCDTAARGVYRDCRVEPEAGCGTFEKRPNPLAATDLLSVIGRITPSGGAVSLTGGEPLIHAEFLQEFLLQLKNHGYRTYLETNGTLHDKLASLLPRLDVVAMDIKLPSATGEEDLFEAHTRFLTLAAETKVFVKVVITGATHQDEVLRCVNIVASVDEKIPLILQPVTPVKANIQPAAPQFLLALQSLCSAILPDVRVIPQCHRFAGLR